jgi:hypothetical protein
MRFGFSLSGLQQSSVFNATVTMKRVLCLLSLQDGLGISYSTSFSRLVTDEQESCLSSIDAINSPAAYEGHYVRFFKSEMRASKILDYKMQNCTPVLKSCFWGEFSVSPDDEKIEPSQKKS